MPIEIDITKKTTPPDLMQRMAKFPAEQNRRIMKFLKQSLFTIQDSVPSYPRASRKPQPFKTDKSRRYFFWALKRGIIQVPYRRGGTLGRSLEVGQPGNIGETKQLGSGSYQARFGTRLKYAPLVIGERQASYHSGTWWQMKELEKKAKPRINRLWQKTVDGMAKFITGKG